METTKLILAALAILSAPPAFAADTARGDAGVKEASELCVVSGETAVLACRTGSDLVFAVCADAGGALRLAIRRAGQPDILLPKNKGDGTVGTGWVPYSGGGGSYARFRSGKLDYVAYSGIGRGWEQAGLSEVDADGKAEDDEALHLAEHVCLPASRSYDAGFPLAAEKAGLRVDETPTFDIPVTD